MITHSLLQTYYKKHITMIGKFIQKLKSVMIAIH